MLALLDQTRAKLTLGMLVDALKGSATTALRNKRATELPAFGSAKACWLGLGLGLGLGIGLGLGLGLELGLGNPNPNPSGNPNPNPSARPRTAG